MGGKTEERNAVDRRVSALAAKSIERSLIDEYLKNHPEVKRAEVIAQFVNGEWVIDNISSILRETFKQREIQDAFQQERILKEIEMESDDRYRACQQSVKNSKRIIDFLFTSSYAQFGLNEKNLHYSFLSQNEARCAKAIAQHYKNKKTVLELMSSAGPPIPKLKGRMLDYFDTLHKQLDFQYKIFDREIALNNEFSGYSQGLIKDHFKKLQTKIKDSKKKQQLLNHVVKAYQTLKQNGFFEIDSATSINLDRFNEMLQEFDVRMTQKREELEAIKKIVAALEKVVEYLETSLGETRSEKKRKPKEESADSPRMAFTSKLSGLFSRVKKGLRSA